MEMLIETACGLDVHKDTAATCIMGSKIKKEVCTFRTTTGNMLEMNGSQALEPWLNTNEITHVAMDINYYRFADE